MPETLALVQGRMGSSRLPGKILLDLGGEAMLGWVVKRARRAETLDGLLVATTSDPSDDPVEAYCRRQGTPFFRGSTFDVLDRLYQAARERRAGTVVRITADCPLIDPQVIDRVVRAFRESRADFAANRLPPPLKRTFPIGLDVEVCSFAGLERAWREADQAYQREHVMPFFYEGIPVEAFDLGRDSLAVSPRGLRVLLVNHVPDYGALRWTVDTPEDLELMRRLLARFEGDDFGWQDVLRLFQSEPELARINQSVAHKSAFDVDGRHTAS